MQWKQAIGIAFVLGAVADAPLAAQTTMFLAAIPAAQPADTSWAVVRQQITQRFQQDMFEIAIIDLLEQESAPSQVSLSIEPPHRRCQFLSSSK